MKKEVCFICGHEEIDVIENSDMRFFQCKQCLVKWGKYIFKE